MSATAHTNAGWVGVLTPPQAEVLELVAQGLTNRQIAAELWKSADTVKHHLQDICGKLEIKARVGSRDGAAACCPRVLAARWWWENIESRADRGPG